MTIEFSAPFIGHVDNAPMVQCTRNGRTIASISLIKGTNNEWQYSAHQSCPVLSDEVRQIADKMTEIQALFQAAYDIINARDKE